MIGNHPSKDQSLCFRLLSVTLACIQNVLLGGVFYGWTSISSTLLTSTDGGPGLTRNYIQIMFVVAAFFSNLGPLLLGIILDNFGPRACSLVSIFIITCGFVLFAYSDQLEFPFFIPAMCLIAFGGPGAQSAIIHLSNLFPAWKATTTAIITGCFQLSFTVFYLFNLFWKEYQIDYQTLFKGYACVAVSTALISIFLWPDTPYSFQEEVQILHIPKEEALEIEDHIGAIRLPSVMMKRKPNEPIRLPPIHPGGGGGVSGGGGVLGGGVLVGGVSGGTSSPSIRAERTMTSKEIEMKMRTTNQGTKGQGQGQGQGGLMIQGGGSSSSSSQKPFQDMENQLKNTTNLSPSPSTPSSDPSSDPSSSSSSSSSSEPTLWSQLSSRSFLRLAVFFLINAYWANLYMGTLDLQLGDSDVLYRQYRSSSFSSSSSSSLGRNALDPSSSSSSSYESDEFLPSLPTSSSSSSPSPSDLFGFQLQLSRYGGLFTLIISAGILLIPLVGALMDKVGYPATSFVISFFGLLWGICQLLQTPLSLLIGFICYAIFRTFLFTYFFAYLADILGFTYYGILAGVLFVLNGFLSLTQYPLSAWAAGSCHVMRQSYLSSYYPYLVERYPQLQLEINKQQSQPQLQSQLQQQSIESSRVLSSSSSVSSSFSPFSSLQSSSALYTLNNKNNNNNNNHLPRLLTEYTTNQLADLEEMESTLSSCTPGRWETLNICLVFSMVILFFYSYLDWVERRAIWKKKNQQQQLKERERERERGKSSSKSQRKPTRDTTPSSSPSSSSSSPKALNNNNNNNNQKSPLSLTSSPSPTFSSSSSASEKTPLLSQV